MKRLCTSLLCLGALGPILTGCGSSSTPPFAVSCTVQPVPAGMIQAAVTVTNNTSTAANAILYGPVFANLRHFYPVVLQPSRVLVKDGNGQNSYYGFVVPRVRPSKPAHLVLRFIPPSQPQSIAVTDVPTVEAGSGDPLQNPSCVIQR